MFVNDNPQMMGSEAIPPIFEVVMEVCFEVKGKNLDERNPECTERVNTFLRKFRRSIEETKIKEDNFRANVEFVDEFQHELLSDTLLLCSQQIKWTCYGRGAEIRNTANAKLGQALKKLEFEEGSYSSKLAVRVVDFHFSGELRHNRWPNQGILTIGF
jgi:hypothetical protein